MATIAPPAASMRPPWRQTWPAPGAAIERWLEAERDQLPLWLPVALGGGITAWLVLPGPAGVQPSRRGRRGTGVKVRVLIGERGA